MMLNLFRVPVMEPESSSFSHPYFPEYLGSLSGKRIYRIVALAACHVTTCEWFSLSPK